jgi:hypothetical protein
VSSFALFAFPHSGEREKGAENSLKVRNKRKKSITWDLSLSSPLSLAAPLFPSGMRRSELSELSGSGNHIWNHPGTTGTTREGRGRGFFSEEGSNPVLDGVGRSWTGFPAHPFPERLKTAGNGWERVSGFGRRLVT